MNVSPDALRRETVSTLNEIESSIRVMKDAATKLGCPPEQLKEHNGSLVMPPLLLAKATCLSTLVQLNEPSKER